MRSTSPNTPELSHLFHEALEQLGWEADSRQLAERVSRLDVGVPLEDEFSVLCGWLGKCQLMHKLSQEQTPPESKTAFQVPDLLGLFNIDSGTQAFLIEVKSNKSQTLSFKPDYLHKLQNYARAIGLPLLIAWKWGPLWTLFEPRHMKKANINHNINFQDALRENLMGSVAGDFAYSLFGGCGLHINSVKQELLRVKEEGDKRLKQWNVVIEDVSFTGKDGKGIGSLPLDIQQLFLSWDLDYSENHTDTHIVQSFFVDEESMLFAHMALVRLLSWQRPSDQDVHWRPLLQEATIVHAIEDFRSVVNRAMDLNIVRNILNQVPQTRPAWCEGNITCA